MNEFAAITIWMTEAFIHYYVYAVSLLLLLLSLINLTPFNTDSIKRGDGRPASITDLSQVWLRRASTAALMVVGVVFPALLWFFIGYLNDHPLVLEERSNTFSTTIANTAIVTAVCFALGKMIRFLYGRFAITTLSSIKRRFTYKVSGDKESDIRDVMGKLKQSKHLPREYYKLAEGLIFVGMDVGDEPIYLNQDQFKETHTEIVGPTRTGKGVAMGCIAEQAIMLGWDFIMHDPKGDKFLPHIMKEVAEQMGARFIYFDLNPNRLGSWEPFTGGIAREKRTRLMWALGMKETGSDADFYKLGEKSAIDDLLKEKDWPINTLIKKLKGTAEDKQAKRAISSLQEMSQIDTFTPKPKKGMKWDHILTGDKQVVVYIRSSLDDELITKMNRLLLIELNQLIIRLDKEGKRKRHCTQLVDEVAFLTSMELANALSTIGGYDCNMILGYQTPAQLMSITDQTVNPEVVKQSINTNCQNKIIYRMPEEELADWAAGQTGTVSKMVKVQEKAITGDYGAESWAGDATYRKAEEKYITSNVFLALPQRVGVLITPGQFSKIVRTCWVPTKEETDFNGAPYATDVTASNKSTSEPVKDKQPPAAGQKKKEQDKKRGQDQKGDKTAVPGNSKPKQKQQHKPKPKIEEEVVDLTEDANTLFGTDNFSDDFGADDFPADDFNADAFPEEAFEEDEFPVNNFDRD